MNHVGQRNAFAIKTYFPCSVLTPWLSAQSPHAVNLRIQRSTYACIATVRRPLRNTTITHDQVCEYLAWTRKVSIALTNQRINEKKYFENSKTDRWPWSLFCQILMLFALHIRWTNTAECRRCLSRNSWNTLLYYMASIHSFIHSFFALHILVCANKQLTCFCVHLFNARSIVQSSKFIAISIGCSLRVLLSWWLQFIDLCQRGNGLPGYG